MPNRILKESICTSETVDQLSWFEECFFYRLIVNCDDFGRMDARPAILRARLFPLKDVTNVTINKALNALRAAGLIDLYTVSGRSILQLRTWERHQQIRAKKSKYPAKEDACVEIPESDINCNQMISDVPVIQSESESESEYKSESESNGANAPTTRARARDGRFDTFWATYPKKVGKVAAQKAFDKIRPSNELFSQMLNAIKQQRASPQWTRDNGQYIPNPATWLNQGRWDDEPTAAPANGAPETSNIFLRMLMEEQNAKAGNA